MSKKLCVMICEALKVLFWINAWDGLTQYETTVCNAGAIYSWAKKWCVMILQALEVLIWINAWDSLTQYNSYKKMAVIPSTWLVQYTHDQKMICDPWSAWGCYLNKSPGRSNSIWDHHLQCWCNILMSKKCVMILHALEVVIWINALDSLTQYNSY